MTALDERRTASASNAATRSTWAFWGTAAGVAGVVANFVAQSDVTEADRKAGAAVMDQLERGSYHLGAVAGFTAVACLLFFAAGLRRWSERQASDSLPLRVAPLALVASAGALIASYGVKGQLASYLDGGFNDATYSPENLYTYFLIDDLAGYFSWWGVAVALGCLAWVSFRERLLVRWVGALAALGIVIPVGFLVLAGFTGFAGVITPVLLIPIGIGMAMRRE